MRESRKSKSALRSPLASPPPQGFTADFSFTTGDKMASRSRVVSRPRGLPVQIAYAAIDYIGVWVTGSLVLYLQSGILPATETLRRPGTAVVYFTITFFYAAMVLLSCASQDLYRTPRDRGALEESLMVVRAVSVATAVLILFAFAFGIAGISRAGVLALGGLNTATLAGWRYLKRRVILHRTLRGIGVSRVLIVGAGKTGRVLAACLKENPQLGYEVRGFLEIEPSTGPRILGAVPELRRLVMEQFINEVFLTSPIDRDVVKEFVLETRQLRVALKVIPDLYDGLAWHAPVHAMGGFPVIELHAQPIPGIGGMVKRMADILIAAIGLVLTAPLLALLAPLVRLDSPGPTFYSAERVGYKGRRFRCWKLRTMTVDADRQKDVLRRENSRQGPFFKIKNDPRVTRLGRWLRKFSLDELPQLWNVLWGDMSMVGPRPHPVDDFTRYSVNHLRRLDVKPGLTGLWQVTARQDPSFETNLALDLEYIENWSSWLDLEILFRTLPEVLQGKGE